MMSRLWLAAALLAIATPVRAFSDPEYFALPAAEGGGAGHYFTGSPSDGHSCSVCHRGGPAPQITLDGLLETFDPGERYHVTLRLKGEDSQALQLELLRESGAHPMLEPADPENLPDSARCESDADAAPAVYSVDVGDRRILGVEDCGAREISFDFTAPNAPRLFFAAGIVRSDGSGTADGDGVLELRRTLQRRGPSMIAGDCSVSKPGRCQRASYGMFALLALVFMRRFSLR